MRVPVSGKGVRSGSKLLRVGDRGRELALGTSERRGRSELAGMEACVFPENVTK